MKQLIACCGLDCEGCDARIATVGNDNELREKTARKWSEMNNAPEITAATINCMGCRADGAKFAYCSDYCEIRKCVNKKGLNMDYLEYKGYKGSVEYSKADNCLFGKVLGMSKDLILYEGNTIDELRADFEAGIENYLEGCLADGVEPRKPYSGTLNIRISLDVHGRIAALAQEAGTTINGYIKQALENQLKMAH